MQLYYDDQNTNSINIFGTYCQLSALQGYNKTLLLKLVKKQKKKPAGFTEKATMFSSPKGFFGNPFFSVLRKEKTSLPANKCRVLRWHRLRPPLGNKIDFYNKSDGS